MSIVGSTEARIRDVKVTADIITAYLVDGRVISVPLAWSWRLSEATPISHCVSMASSQTRELEDCARLGREKNGVLLPLSA